jgi:hypothetical protein
MQNLIAAGGLINFAKEMLKENKWEIIK